jgi:hypothetical protein
MDTQSAIRALAHLWGSVAESRQRSLTESEIKDMRRLCDNLNGGVPRRTAFNGAIGNLCLRLYSCGIFEVGRAPQGLDEILEDIDRLREMLTGTARPQTQT